LPDRNLSRRSLYSHFLRSESLMIQSCVSSPHL
jgi:hypothetical protein